MQRKELERLSRDELITRAESIGVSRPRSLTTAELLDELVLRGDARPDERARARGWFGRAKDLLKSAIERGLDIPEATSRARAPSRSWPPAPPPPLPTVTLAEIYAAQGHLERAVQVLDEVLAKDGAHAEASRLRDDYQARIQRTVVRAPANVPAVPTSSAGDRAAAPVAAAPAPEDAPEEAREEQPGAGAPAAIDDEPLETSEEDDIDEIVAVAVDPSTIYLYWEVRPTTAARARLDAPGGALTVRTVTVRAGAGVPASDVRDDRVDALSGELFVRGLRDGAHVRVSVGWLGPAGFAPLAVAADVVTPRGAPSSGVATQLGAWTPPASGPRPAAVGVSPPARAGHTVPRSATPATAPSWTAAPPPPRRTVLLQPAEVFDVPGTGPVPVGVWQPPGSSDLVTLYGSGPGGRGRRDARYGAGPGGASDLLVGGASDLVVGGASGHH